MLTIAIWVRLAPPEGFQPQIRIIRETTIADAVTALVTRLFDSAPPPKLPKHQDRNRQIRELAASGMTQTDIAKRFGITSERVNQILHQKSRKNKKSKK